MKEKISTGLTVLRGFYDVVNTKEKIALLIVIWALSGVTWFGWKLGNVETIERLILTYTKCIKVIDLKTDINQCEPKSKGQNLRALPG